MRRATKTEPMSVGAKVALGAGGMLVVGTVVGLVLASSSSSTRLGPTVAQAGFMWLPGCEGVKIVDEAKAMAWAKDLGRRAAHSVMRADEKLVLVDRLAQRAVPGAAVLHNLVAFLGTPECELGRFPKPALGFLFRLLRAYLQGAGESNFLDAATAATWIENLRKEVLALGVAAAEVQ